MKWKKLYEKNNKDFIKFYKKFNLEKKNQSQIFSSINLVKVFEPRLLLTISDFISKKNEIKFFKKNINLKNKNDFPNLSFLKNKTILNYKIRKNKFKKWSFIKKCALSISNLFCTGPKIGVTHNSLDLFKLIKNLIINNFKVYLVDDLGIDKRNFNAEIKNFEKFYKSFNLNKIINFKIFKKMMHEYVSKNNFHKIELDFLITGSLQSIKNRIIADSLNKKHSKCKIIAIHHGDGFQLFNPLSLNLETNYADYFFTYGKVNFKPYKNLYRKRKNLKLIRSSSNQILRNLHINENTKKKLNRSDTILYVPSHHQPTCVLTDRPTVLMYSLWQEKLLNSLKDKKLYIKMHPKLFSKFDKNFYKKFTKNIIYGDLLETAKKFDVVVTDVPTTSLNLLMSTNIDIIYFDIGFNKINPILLKDLKNRVNYIKINNVEKFQINFDRIKLKTKKNKNIVKKISTFNKFEREECLVNYLKKLSL